MAANTCWSARCRQFRPIKAQTADWLGNLTYHGTGRNFNPVMATAARTVIVEVERLVEPGELGSRDGSHSGAFVDRIRALRSNSYSLVRVKRSKWR